MKILLASDLLEAPYVVDTGDGRHWDRSYLSDGVKKRIAAIMLIEQMNKETRKEKEIREAEEEKRDELQPEEEKQSRLGKFFSEAF